MRPGWAVWLLSAGGVALSLWGVAALSVVVALGAGPSPPHENRLASTMLLEALVLTVVGPTACVLWLGHDFRSVIIAARH